MQNNVSRWYIPYNENNTNQHDSMTTVVTIFAFDVSLLGRITAIETSVAEISVCIVNCQS